MIGYRQDCASIARTELAAPGYCTDILSLFSAMTAVCFAAITFVTAKNGSGTILRSTTTIPRP
jgi:hypothetical protein